jgi:hypothetical protein
MLINAKYIELTGYTHPKEGIILVDWVYIGVISHFRKKKKEQNKQVEI